MKSPTILFFVMLLLMSFNLDSAPRSKLQTSCSTCCCTIDPSLTRAEVEKPQQISEEERDRQMFMGFLGIVSSFVKLFIDPQNIPEAKQNAMNIVNGVVQLAQVITRRSLTPRMQAKLMDYVLEVVQNELEVEELESELN